MEIEQSKHKPPGAHLVPELIEDMCDYVNEHWDGASALHLSAYIMWRLNWIHPFADGNGRTSRIVAYVVLCIKLGYVIPGANTIPDQITANRNPYFDALDAADQTYLQEKIEVSKMEALMAELLGAQLYSVVVAASGSTPQE